MVANPSFGWMKRGEGVVELEASKGEEQAPTCQVRAGRSYSGSSGERLERTCALVTC